MKAAGENVPPLTKEVAKVEFNDQADYWWNRYTSCLSFSRQVPIPNSSQRRHTFHHEVTTDGVSAGVLMLHPAPSAEAPSPSAEAPPSGSKKRKRQQKALPPPNGKKDKQKQQQQTSTEWVRDLPGRDIGQPPRIVGLDPGRKSLFTAAIHSQSAADSLQEQHTPDSTPDSKYTTLSWTSSRWREASGIKYRQLKTELWYNKRPQLKAALEDTPSAKVATVDLFRQHITYRLRHEAAAVKHFGDKRHRHLRWRTFRRRQSAYAAICRDITAGSADTVVAYGDASFSSSCCKGNPSTPTVSLRRCLGYHCKVYNTDEFRTSRLCCACKTPMPGMPLPVTGNLLPFIIVCNCCPLVFPLYSLSADMKNLYQMLQTCCVYYVWHLHETLHSTNLCT